MLTEKRNINLSFNLFQLSKGISHQETERDDRIWEFGKQTGKQRYLADLRNGKRHACV